MTEEKIKSLSPCITQQIMKQLGMYGSTQLGNEIYYLAKVIHLLISDLDEEFIKKEWENSGRNWKKTKKNFERIELKSIEVKTYYDAIEDKKMEKKDKEVLIKSFYLKTASKIPMIMPEIYDLFLMLVKKTNLQRLQVPAQDFKVLEHSNFKSLDMTNKPTQNKESEKKEEE